MQQERKRVLIVDDMEIDRIILKSILSSEFEVIEADSGNRAFEYITKVQKDLDVILLDISMPHIDGFDVLRFMDEKKVEIPVFLVTAEPTRENVEKALKYNVAEFISKPFDQEDILRRLRSKLGVIPNYDRNVSDMAETLKYITDLESVYQNYLANFDKSDEHYRIMSDLMKILLVNYRRTIHDSQLDGDTIELISKAAYFCDIGYMLIPDKSLQVMSGYAEGKNLQKRHTMLGASLVRLNRAKNCGYFVEICSSMCLHHHERFDGTGYPNGVVGRNNSIYNQMCGLVDEFDHMRAKFYGDKSKPVKFVIKRLTDENAGVVSPEIAALLQDCEGQIFDYFMKRNF